MLFSLADTIKLAMRRVNSSPHDSLDVLVRWTQELLLTEFCSGAWRNMAQSYKPIVNNTNAGFLLKTIYYKMLAYDLFPSPASLDTIITGVPYQLRR